MLLSLCGVAFAVRPTEGGTYAYAADDDVRSLDAEGGLARVWYSASGSSAVPSDDDDGDGVPDFAAFAGTVAEEALALYADSGFRAPISDEGAGGSDAFDVYLVDFGGAGDGAYNAEVCSGSAPRQCSGWYAMENDFRGYGYASTELAVQVVTSHELFHAVQAAYDSGEESWFAEGTAVWAENLYLPENDDFVWFCDYYLTDVGRSLDEPPAGPVPTFAYATALWWWFLTDRHGDAVIEALLQEAEAAEDSDGLLAGMAAVLESDGSSLEEDWTTFARWNLATGRRSGVAESYPFASEIGPPRAEATGAAIAEDNRFYPLAASYFELEHEGGEVWFAAEEDAPEVVVSLHAEDGTGRTGEALWEGAATAEPVSLGELDAGTYWLVGTNPTLAENSTKLIVCLGDAESAGACAPVDTGRAEDTGPEETGDSGEPGDEEAADEAGAGGGGGCGCQAGHRRGDGLVLLGGALVLTLSLYRHSRSIAGSSIGTSSASTAKASS